MALADKHDDRGQFYSKSKTEIVAEEIALAHDKNVLDLYFAFSAVIQRKQAEFRDHHHTINSDEFSVEDKIKDILSFFQHEKTVSFMQFFEPSHSLDEVVTVFLAMLELIKNHAINFQQDDTFGEIILTITESEALIE